MFFFQDCLELFIFLLKNYQFNNHRLLNGNVNFKNLRGFRFWILPDTTNLRVGTKWITSKLRNKSNQTWNNSYKVFDD